MFIIDSISTIPKTIIIKADLLANGNKFFNDVGIVCSVNIIFHYPKPFFIPLASGSTLINVTKINVLIT